MKIKDTPEYKDLPDYKLRYAIDYILDAATNLQAEKSKLNSQLDTLANFQPVQKLQQYLPYPKVWNNGDNNYYNYGYSNKDVTPAITVEKIDEHLKLQEPIYAANVEICKSNAKAKEVALKFMDKLGVERKRYDYPTPRSKKKDNITCAWVGEFDKVFITNCDYSWGQMKEWYKKQTDSLKKYEVEQSQKIEATKKAQESKIKEQEKTALIVKMVEKYKLDFDEPIPAINEVIDALAKKNKYLYLAYYLSLNRGDWSEGSNYAEIGLDYFYSQMGKETSGINDKEISEEIQSYISDWDGDGRIFRDASNWSYDKLFNLAGEQIPELSVDWHKLLEYKEY